MVCCGEGLLTMCIEPCGDILLCLTCRKGKEYERGTISFVFFACREMRDPCDINRDACVPGGVICVRERRKDEGCGQMQHIVSRVWKQ